MAVTMLPGAEVVPAMERGVLDAADSFNPSIDLALGMPDVAKHYLTPSHHRPAGAFEIIFNKPKFDALPQKRKDVLREAAWSASSDQLWEAYARFARTWPKSQSAASRFRGPAPTSSPSSSRPGTR
jgi:TRAP-type mannitol/chloroaromatic compound transport system substrate-binding protein